MDTTKELALTNDPLALTGLGMGDIHSLADAFKESGLFPDIEKKAQAIVKVVAGQELSLPPVYSMQNFYIIKGKLSMAAEVMGLLLKRSGQYDYQVANHTDKECQIQFKQKIDGAWKDTYLSTFTLADAQRAGLVRQGGNWITFPKAMLFSRAMSQGTRIVAPHLLGGARTIEEAESITPDTTADVEPPPEPEKPKSRRKKATEAFDPLIQQAEREATERVEAASPTAETEAPGGDESQESSTAVEVTPPEPPIEPTTTKVEFKRDPGTIKTIADMYAALWHDYELQPAKVMKELGVKSNQEITETPANCYRIVATVYGARPEGA